MSNESEGFDAARDRIAARGAASVGEFDLPVVVDGWPLSTLGRVVLEVKGPDEAVFAYIRDWGASCPDWTCIHHHCHNIRALRVIHDRQPPRKETTTMSTKNSRSIRVSWTIPGIVGRSHRLLHIPADATNIRCEAEIEVEKDDELDVVRVRFPGNMTEYCYRHDLDAGIQPGDYVLAPPSPLCSHPQVVRVTGFGRNAYSGPIHKRVTPLPKEA
jgi:hypothetical protein